jgi:hypothetical protein
VIDLSYDDPLAPSIEIDAIIATGRRLRLRRRIVAGASACLVVAAVAIGATPFTGAFPGSSAPASPSDVVARELAALHPADTPLVMLDQPHAGYQEFAYVDGNGDAGGGFIEVSGPQIGFLSHIGPWQSAADASNPAKMIKPVFQVPVDPRDAALAIGFAPAGTARVATTFKGTTTVVSVTTVVAGSHGFVAYAAFLPLHGSTSWSDRDITSVIATDADGRIVAQVS